MTGSWAKMRGWRDPTAGGGKRCLRNMENPTLSSDPQPSHMNEYKNLPLENDKVAYT